jgi:hypothetical protein
MLTFVQQSTRSWNPQAEDTFSSKFSIPVIGLAAGASTIEQRASACMQSFQNKINPLCEGSRGRHYFDEDKSNDKLIRMTEVMANRLGTCSAWRWDTVYHPRAQLTMECGGKLTNIANQERKVMLSEHGITVQMSAMNVTSMPDALAFGSISPSTSAMNPICNEATLSSVICSPKTRRKQVLPSQAATGDTNQEPRYYKTKLCKYSVTGGCPRGARFEFWPHDCV